MAAFSSYQHLPFHLDSVFLQNFPTKMPGFSEEPNSTNPNPTYCFSQFYQSGQQRSLENSCLEQSNTKVSLGNNNNKQSTDSSSLVLDKVESGEQVTQKVVSMDKKRKFKDGSSLNSAQSKDTRDEQVKSKKQKKSKNEEEEEEKKGGRSVVVVVDHNKKKDIHEEKKKKKVGGEEEEAPIGYIHVRARRGQATDSHSLAERVRREKISERMKQLQALVPGCDKVTGKALMLDEIINYVQSLQNQVEFLSMKLSSVNPMFYDFGMDLDGLIMVKPAEANMQQGSPSQQPTGTINCTFTTPNNYHHHPLLDTSTSLVFHQQVQMPNILSDQSNGSQMLWDVDEERQKMINNQCGLTLINNLASFH